MGPGAVLDTSSHKIFQHLQGDPYSALIQGGERAIAFALPVTRSGERLLRLGLSKYLQRGKGPARQWYATSVRAGLERTPHLPVTTALARASAASGGGEG